MIRRVGLIRTREQNTLLYPKNWDGKYTCTDSMISEIDPVVFTSKPRNTRSILSLRRGLTCDCEMLSKRNHSHYEQLRGFLRRDNCRGDIRDDVLPTRAIGVLGLPSLRKRQQASQRPPI